MVHSFDGRYHNLTNLSNNRMVSWRINPEGEYVVLLHKNAKHVHKYTTKYYLFLDMATKKTISFLMGE
jgi:hypothetical protein